MSSIMLKGIIDEDFVNYKVPSMVLECPRCSFKCGSDLCHNSDLACAPDITIDVFSVCERYINNPISEAIVFQGLEPLDRFDEIIDVIKTLRTYFGCKDDIVIYTGYIEDEVQDKIIALSQYSNIIMKFGRYIPNQVAHFDKVLGVCLASDNQYARRIS